MYLTPLKLSVIFLSASTVLSPAEYCLQIDCNDKIVFDIMHPLNKYLNEFFI